MVTEIPLERNDWTCLPKDPRTDLPDYCYVCEDEDSFPWTLPLPRFWREVLRKIEQNVNEERRLNGKPKLSTSLIKDRVLQQTQRLAQRRVDPRIRAQLERSTLFPEPPQKAQCSSKSHNQSVPNLKTSIFDVENSEDALSDSSSSLSFSSANESGTSNKRLYQSSSRFDDFSDDDDLSFNTFNSKRAKTDSENQKVPPLKIDLKNVNERKSDTINGTSKYTTHFK